MFLRFIASRLLATAIVLFLVSVAVFVLIRLTPGDPVTLQLTGGFSYDEEAAQRARERLGLNDPIAVGYVKWVGSVVQGDWGHSIRGQGDVLEAITDRLPTTIQLGVASMFAAVFISVIAGTLAAARRGSRIDSIVTLFAMGGVAMPNFWLAIILILVFGVQLHWFPLYGSAKVWEDPVSGISHLVLPSLALGVGLAGPLTRQIRSSMLDVLSEDYMRTAHAKGLSERKVLINHGLRNALLPVVTLLGLQVGRVLGGAIIIEQVFAIPGIGRLAVQAILNKDFMVVQGVVLISALIVVLANMIVDILYGRLDPRIRVS